MDVLSLICSKIFSTFKQRIEYILKLLISELYSVYLIMQLIYIILILYNYFYLIFIALL